MFFIEDSDFLTDKHKAVIEMVRTPGFSFFYQYFSLNRPDSVAMQYEPDTHILLGHTLILRPEDRMNAQFYLNNTLVLSKGTATDYKGYNSVYAEIFEDMLITFCNKNKVEYKETLRGVINLTFNNGQGQCFPHIDHKEYHKQLIIYLNDPADKESHTVILDENTPLGIPDDGKQKQLKRVVPEKYKGVCFENLPHYQVYPKFGDRIVSVFTFK